MGWLEKTLASGMVLSLCFASCTCEKALPPKPETAPADFSERQPAGPTSTPKVTRSPVRTPSPPAPAGTPVALPPDFPGEVPVFGDAAVDKVHDLPNDGHNVVFRTSGSVSEVTQFYHDKLSKAGWESTQQFERGTHSFMTYKKGKLIANVTVSEDANDPSRRVIAIMYETEQDLPFDEF